MKLPIAYCVVSFYFVKAKLQKCFMQPCFIETPWFQTQNDNRPHDTNWMNYLLFWISYDYWMKFHHYRRKSKMFLFEGYEFCYDVEIEIRDTNFKNAIFLRKSFKIWMCSYKATFARYKISGFPSNNISIYYRLVYWINKSFDCCKFNYVYLLQLFLC